MNTSNFGHANLSRDQVLVAHAAEMIARTSLSQDDFAQALSHELHDLVPAKAAEKEVPNFQTLAASNDVPAFLKASGRWLKRVERWLCGEVDLPSWVEEAWVRALAPAYRERCTNELASRYGLVGARDLGLDGCPVTAFGQLVTRLGTAVEATGLVLADGQISDEDRPHLPSMIEALLAVESRSCELRRAAERVMATGAPTVSLRVAG